MLGSLLIWLALLAVGVMAGQRSYHEPNLLLSWSLYGIACICFIYAAGRALRGIVLTLMMVVALMVAASAQQYVPPPLRVYSESRGELPAQWATINSHFGILSSTVSHMGLVATNLGAATGQNTTNKQFMSRSPHYATDTIYAANMTLPCYFLTAGAGTDEVPVGAPMTYTAAFEFNSVITQVTFNKGGTSGTCPDGGQVTTDTVTISGGPIPKGARFFARVWGSNATGIIYVATLPNLTVDVENGGGYAFGVTTPDLTLGGAVSAGAASNRFQPLAISSITNVRSFCIIGDSRPANVYDRYYGPSGDIGEIARGIGRYAAYTNLAVGGDRLDYFISKSAARAALCQSQTTDIINELGINDDQGSRTLAAKQADFATIKGYFPGQNVSLTTHPPITTQTGVSISALVTNGNVQTATVASTAGMAVGQDLVIAGSSVSTSNGACKVISVINATSVACVSATSTGTASNTGTITYTDNWQSLATQTPFANEALRVAQNDWIRYNAVSLGYKSVLEIADYVESGRNSGKWAAFTGTASTYNGNGSATLDGVHEAPAGIAAIFSYVTRWPSLLN